MKKLDQAIQNLSKSKIVQVDTGKQLTEQNNSELALQLSKKCLALERLSQQIHDKVFNDSLNNRQGAVDDTSFFYREQ